MVTVRKATRADLPYLKERLRNSTQEHVDLDRCIVHVAEHDGKIVGLGAGRMIWQYEPLWLFPEFVASVPKNTRRRATLKLARAFDGFIADRVQNCTGIHSYFCFVKSKAIQKLAANFGFLRIYKGGQFFGKDL